MTYAYKKYAVLPLVAGGLLVLSSSAGAVVPLPHTILTFDFEGDFAMYGTTGTALVDPVSPPTVTGTILLDAVTFGGTAAMGGEFYGKPWTAAGDLSAYLGALAADRCGGAPMCAHSNIDFAWNGNLIPVQAAFGMTPLFPGVIDLLSLSPGAQFEVESIDTEPDGVKGTAMTTGPFEGFTPYFTGTATLVNVNPLGSPINNPQISISPVPEPTAWVTMLAGLGLIAAAVVRRESAQRRPPHFY